MGRKTHGPVLVAAIEHSDLDKVKEILLTQIKDKHKILDLCHSEVRRMGAEYYECPILLAATLPDPAIFHYLVANHGANVNYVMKETIRRKVKVRTPLLIAVRLRLYDTVDTILCLNAATGVQDHKGRTPLHHAVRKADYRMTKMLLSRGAQVNVTDVAGNTPLHIATIFGHVELVKLLARHDGDLYKKAQHGAIPIHIAAKEGHSALVRLFCQFEIPVNIKVPCYDGREKAPVHVAAEEGHAETVLMLLDVCGAEPNIRDSDGETPLHCCSLRDYDPLGMKVKDDFTETTRVLVQYGAHVDLRNNRGETPLHLAARNEFQKTVDVLLQAGSDPILEDNDGNKPMDLTSPDDTVTRQFLKGAMDERERVMSDAMELEAKGFSTSLKSAASARSGLNITGGGGSGGNWSGSQSRLGPNPLRMIGGSSSVLNRSLNMLRGPIPEGEYLEPLSARINGVHNTTDPGTLDMGRTQSTSSSGSRTTQQDTRKKSQSIVAQLRKKQGSANNLEHSSDSSHTQEVRSGPHTQQPPQHPPVSAAKPPVRHDPMKHTGRSLPTPPVEKRNIGVSRKESEISSVWDVSPRSSVSTFKAADEKSYESLPIVDEYKAVLKKPQAGGYRQKPAKGPPAIAIQAAFPKSAKPVVPPRIPDSDQSDSEDTYFDDESFDTLDTFPDERPSVASRIPAVARTPEEVRKIQNAVSDNNLVGWVDEQTELLKDGSHRPVPKPRLDQGPVARSTPPVDKNRLLDQAFQEDSSVYTTTTESEISRAYGNHRDAAQSPSRVLDRLRSESASSAETVQRRPPPPIPPKPGKRPVKPTPAAVSSSSGSGGGRNHAIQLEVDDETPGQTTIRIRPLDGDGTSSEEDVVSSSYRTTATESVDGVSSSTRTDVYDTDDLVERNNNLAAKGSPRRGKQRPGGPARRQVQQDDPHWEKIPVSKNSDLYWEHNRSTEEIYKAQRESPPKARKVKQQPPAAATPSPPAQPPNQRPLHAHRSDSDLSVSSLEDGRDVGPMRGRPVGGVPILPMPQQQQQQPARKRKKNRRGPQLQTPPSPTPSPKLFIEPAAPPQQPQPQQPQQPVQPPSQREEVRVGQAITDEYRFFKSMGDLQSASPSDIGRRLERKISDGDILSYDQDQWQQQQQQRKQPDVMNASMTSQSSTSSARRRQNNTEQQRQTALKQQLAQQQQQLLQQQLHQQRSEDDDDGEFYDEIDEDRQQRRVTIGSEEIIPNRPRPGQGQGRGQGESPALMPGQRVVTYYRGESQPLTVVGGNAQGVFVHMVETGSDAHQKGVAIGDQILRINSKSVQGRTREEVVKMLDEIKVETRLVLSEMKEVHDIIMRNGGRGDEFYIRANFRHDPLHKGELAIREGDIFAVIDTLPDGRRGWWTARKMAGPGSSEAPGLIPNEEAAHETAVNYTIAQTRSREIKQRGGFIRKSFGKRSKSLDRGKESAEFRSALKNVVAYERVEQRPPPFRRPVVLLGLFCDSVRDLLVQECPDDYGVPTGSVEINTDAPKNDDSIPLADVRVIQNVMNQSRHCLVIVSPRCIQYLQEKTDLNPIVAYLCPQNKAVVKGLKERFAPEFARKPNVMFDEATQFAKQYGHVFTATVYYTSDNKWFTDLLQAIGAIQNQPQWCPVQREEKPDEGSDAGDPFEVDFGNGSGTGGGGPQQRRGRQPRESKTTDDIPDEIQNVLSRHAGGMPPKGGLRTQSIGDVLEADSSRGRRGAGGGGGGGGRSQSIGDALHAEDEADVGVRRPRRGVQDPMTVGYPLQDVVSVPANLHSRGRDMATRQQQEQQRYSPYQQQPQGYMDQRGYQQQQQQPRPILKSQPDVSGTSYGDDTFNSGYNYNGDQDTLSASSTASGRQRQRPRGQAGGRPNANLNARRAPAQAAAAPAPAMTASQRKRETPL